MNIASSDTAIQVNHLSKKFAQSLRRAMAYGLRDIARTAMVPKRSRAAAEAVPNEPLRPSEFWALRDVNFAIRRGERVGIIGPNGSGKSTLFSILSGIYGPSEGHVEVCGRLQALIALGAGFHPLLSGRENVYINAAILGFNTAWTDAKIDQIIEFADIGEFIDAPVKNYSSGMLVRLGFAIAANMDPDIMLVDEVLAVGDARFQSKSIGFMKRLVEGGRTVVMVSHALSQVLKVCERVIWLDHGRLVMDGDARDVVQAYSTWVLDNVMAPASTHGGQDRTVNTDCISMTYRIVPQEVMNLSHLPGGSPKLPVVIRGTTLRIEIDYRLLISISGKLDVWICVREPRTSLRLVCAACSWSNCMMEAKAGQSGRVIMEFPNIQLSDGAYLLEIAATDISAAGSTGSLLRNIETAPSFIVTSRPADIIHPFENAEEGAPALYVPAHVSHERA